jgi:hypothetical protein
METGWLKNMRQRRKGPWTRWEASLFPFSHVKPLEQQFIAVGCPPPPQPKPTVTKAKHLGKSFGSVKLIGMKFHNGDSVLEK